MAARRKRPPLDEPKIRRPLGQDAVLVHRLLREPSRSAGDGALVVEVVVQRRDGAPGPRTPFVQLGRGHIRERLVDEPDLRVAAVLPGGTLAEWIPLAPENREGRYRLASAQVERALPWVLRSQRAHVDDGPRLVWVGDTAWQLEARVEREASTGRVQLRFDLVRDEERLVYDDPELWRIGAYFLVDAIGGRLASESAARYVDALRERGATLGSDEHELVGLLAGAPKGLTLVVASAPLASPTPLVAVTPVEHARTLDVALAFDYDGERLGATELRDVVRGPSGGLARRDRAREAEHVRQFATLQREPGDDLADAPIVRVAADRGTTTPDGLPALVARAEALGWRVEAERRVLRIGGTQASRVTSGVDWFELDGEVRFDDKAYARFEDLVRAAQVGEAWVVLDDGSYGLVPDQWLAGFPLLSLARREAGGALRFRRSQAWLLAAWLRDAADDDAALARDEALRRAHEHRARLVARAPIAAPTSFQGTLRDYQEVALGWFQALRDAGAGGCLADDMGLGKTVQVLAHLEHRRLAGGGPMLVIAPRSVVHQWSAEAARFAPALEASEHGGVGRATTTEAFRAGRLIVTSYGTLRRDVELLASIEFDVVVLDEANAIKNPASQTARAARALRANGRLALTGTPIENSLGDLWALSEFLNPGLLGGQETYTRLVASSANPAVEVDEPSAAAGLVSGAARRGDVIGALQRLVAPFLLRRTKSEVLASLPPRTEQTVLLTPSDDEVRRYEALRQVVFDEVVLRGGKKLGLVALEGLLRLRQEACHPGLIDPSLVDEGSTKIDEVVARLVEIAAEGHKALVFSQFTRLLAILRRRLDAAQVAYEYLDGATVDRATPVERFQSDPSRTAFLISLKAGGYGLNLTAADFVFLLDPWWNPAAEAQAIDRAHRLGRTRPVVAYRFVVRGTLEEKVVALQAHKRALADALLAADPADPVATAGLSAEDLAALLTA